MICLGCLFFFFKTCNLSEKQILFLHDLVSDDCDGSITPPLRVGSWSSGGGGKEWCRLRQQVKWCCRKVRPAQRHHLAVEPATPDASEPVRREKETRRGRSEPGGRPSRCLLMSFSLVAEGRGDGCGMGDCIFGRLPQRIGLKMRSNRG